MSWSHLTQHDGAHAHGSKGKGQAACAAASCSRCWGLRWRWRPARRRRGRHARCLCSGWTAGQQRGRRRDADDRWAAHMTYHHVLGATWCSAADPDPATGASDARSGTPHTSRNTARQCTRVRRRLVRSRASHPQYGRAAWGTSAASGTSHLQHHSGTTAGSPGPPPTSHPS